MKTMKWKMSKAQKKLLDALFREVETKKIKKVLDMGAGRTSVHYLASRFSKIRIKAVVYPGDERKIKPILECVPEKNYEIIESDIRNLKIKKVDLVLAHLFLGEAEKFAKNKFNTILDALFSIKTRYLVVVNIFRDNIDYRLLLKYIAEKGEIMKVVYQVSEKGDECIGLLIKK
jgi:predicted RNA methylase